MCGLCSHTVSMINCNVNSLSENSGIEWNTNTVQMHLLLRKSVLLSKHVLSRTSEKCKKLTSKF